MLMASGKRHKSSFVVLTIGMDGLAIINESFGYAVGDLALKAFAQRLMQRARSSDILGCFGGAQFLYLIDYDVSVATMEHSCRRLVDALSFSIELENVGLSLSASIGAAIYPADGATAAELLEATSGAMRRARELGGGYSLVSGPPPPRGENTEVGTAAPADNFGNQLPKFADAAPLFESDADPASAKASLTPSGENAPSEPLSEGRFTSIPHEIADDRAPGMDGVHRYENRRAERRQRVLKRGILVTNNGFSTVDCVIRDLSAHGARVAVEAEYKAPPQFSLLVVETGNRLPAERRWQKGKEIGLRFLG
jgi:diguanylate cyclase (GGDEF)-like protein